MNDGEKVCFCLFIKVIFYFLNYNWYYEIDWYIKEDIIFLDKE